MEDVTDDIIHDLIGRECTMATLASQDPDGEEDDTLHSSSSSDNTGSGNNNKSANKPKYLQKMKEVSDVPYSMEEVFYAVIDEEYTFVGPWTNEMLSEAVL